MSEQIDHASGSTGTDQYRVRPFEPGDTEGILDLFEAVWGERRSEAWFEWKYRSNPYVDHVPVMVVVDDRGNLVGARPLFVVPLGIAGERVLALQPGDTMVHPDHRRRGLFTRMTERTIDRYRDHEAALFFNFPNSKSRPGYMKLGWRTVGPVSTYYRIQQPSTWLETDGLLGRAIEPVADAAAAVGTRIVDATAPSGGGSTIRRHDTIPTTLLASLYDRAPPSGIHAVRDDDYVRWRYGNPQWSYRTYVARKDGTAIAAAVVAMPDDGETVRITDLVPPKPTDSALAALCSAIVTEYAHADAILAPPTFATSVRRRFGFLDDARPPLSAMTTPRTLVTRPVVPETTGWTIADTALTEASNWTITFTEQDNY